MIAFFYLASIVVFNFSVFFILNKKPYNIPSNKNYARLRSTLIVIRKLKNDQEKTIEAIKPYLTKNSESIVKLDQHIQNLKKLKTKA